MKKKTLYQAPGLETLSLIQNAVLCASGDEDASATNESFTIGEEIDFD